MPEVFRGPITVRAVPGKGRGVLTTRAVRADEPLCTDPCLALTVEDCERLEATSLHSHYFAHPETDGAGCIVLGPISLVNHSPEPNCRLDWVEGGLGWTVTLLAGRDLGAGEELSIDYVCELWFDPVP